MFQGIMAVAKIPEPPTLEQVIENSPKPGLFVAIDGMSNADNMGTLVLNCTAFSVHALLISRSSSSPFRRRSVRSSMGSIFEIPVLEELDLIASLGELRRRNFRCIAAHPHATAKILPEAEMKSDCCIVFGNEAHGISTEVLAACDDAVAIPMPGTVDSLNVSSAGAVFLYEAWRQRNAFCKTPELLR